MKAGYPGAASSLRADTRSDGIHRIESAEGVLHQIMPSPDKGILALESGIRFSVIRQIFRPIALSILLAGSWSVASPQTTPVSQGAAAAPTTKSADPLDRESPQSAAVSFLEACHNHQYEKAWKYFDLRNASAQQRLQDGPGLARQLEQILDRDAKFDVATLSRAPDGDRNDALPPDREHLDTFTLNGHSVALDLQRVELRSGLRVWLVSADSLPLVPQIARLISDSPIERHLPEPLIKWRFVDTELWRWIALALLGAVAVLASKWLCRLVVVIGGLLLRRFVSRTGDSFLDEFTGPLRLLVAVAAFRAAMGWIDPSALLRLWLGRCLTLLLVSGLAWLAAGVADVVVRRLRGLLEARHQNFSYSVLPVLSRVLKVIIWLLAITGVLSNWGYNTTTILAGLGVGGLAIALAAQKTIENLFGGVSVISDRPVSVGDFCRFGDRVGTVEDIGLRSTRIRTLDRTLVSVPNSQFSSMMLENFSKRDKVWFHLMLNLRRETTPEQVRTLLDTVTRILQEHPRVETGSLPVRFIGVGSYSLDVEVFAYVLTPSFDEFLQLQQELLLSILDAVEVSGTALALPTQATVEYPVVNPRGESDAQKNTFLAQALTHH